ncbi:hypothetical protein AGR3A_Cc120039 [Agrobacterium tomkonis CFBP 6623]|uniref:Uncharacterized protein n=1 Tax=Agrobacterium tomkonis CFBP 6623 TaxID=1183432 RepID=A0A1S7NMK1_9HYPH|nr:hypothetical protein AGR3A_Cc120039 [Agrobacterium tomkonis CFBP 6623]
MGVFWRTQEPHFARLTNEVVRVLLWVGNVLIPPRGWQIFQFSHEFDSGCCGSKNLHATALAGIFRRALFKIGLLQSASLRWPGRSLWRALKRPASAGTSRTSSPTLTFFQRCQKAHCSQVRPAGPVPAMCACPTWVAAIAKCAASSLSLGETSTWTMSRLAFYGARRLRGLLKHDGSFQSRAPGGYVVALDLCEAGGAKRRAADDCEDEDAARAGQKKAAIGRRCLLWALCRNHGINLDQGCLHPFGKPPRVRRKPERMTRPRNR